MRSGRGSNREQSDLPSLTTFTGHQFSLNYFGSVILESTLHSFIQYRYPQSITSWHRLRRRLLPQHLLRSSNQYSISTLPIFRCSRSPDLHSKPFPFFFCLFSPKPLIPHIPHFSHPGLITLNQFSLPKHNVGKNR